METCVRNDFLAHSLSLKGLVVLNSFSWFRPLQPSISKNAGQNRTQRIHIIKITPSKVKIENLHPKIPSQTRLPWKGSFWKFAARISTPQGPVSKKMDAKFESSVENCLGKSLQSYFLMLFGLAGLQGNLFCSILASELFNFALAGLHLGHRSNTGIYSVSWGPVPMKVPFSFEK